MIDWLLSVAPLMGAVIVPAFGIIWKVANDRRDPGAVRRMRRHGELYGVLPEEARKQLLPLLVSEAESYAANNLRKVQRKVNGATVAALVFVSLMTAGLLYPLISYGVQWWPLFIVAGVVALFGLLLIVAGLQQLFTYDAPPAARPAGSAKQARK